MSDYFNGTGTIGFTCDVCGKEIQVCTGVNGMRFCAKCYLKTFENNTSQYVDMLHKEMYELKIADLEAKLAESEKNIVLLEGLRKSEEEKKDIAMKRVSELKQQLAEKENDIKKLTLFHFGDEVNEPILTTTQIIKHAKTYFAIEQLVNVQKYISDNAVYLKEEVFCREINNYIDQQIKELKVE